MALLANLLVSGGISFPSVAQPMWIVAALALNSVGAPTLAPARPSWIATVAPLPVAGAVCLGFYVFIYTPVATCMSPLREARKWYGTYVAKMEEGEEKEARKALRYIVQQLEVAAWGGPRHKEKAVLADPFLELSQWQGEEWKQNHPKGIPLTETPALAAGEAVKIDPDGTEGYWAKYQAYMALAMAATIDVKKLTNHTAQAMAEIVKRDPTEARFHFLLADLYFQLDDQSSWERESQEALRLDQIAVDPTRQLKASQRLQVQARLEPDNISIQYDLAEAFYREGDTESCKRAAEDVQRLDRNAKDSKKLSETQRQQVQLWLKTG
jgi:predicted Zn-dependent protease